MKYTFLLSLLLSFSSSLMAADIVVTEAYVRATPPGHSISGAFMTLHNSSANTRALVKAQSNVAEKVELHTHVHDNGVMRMREVEQIDIQANSLTELKPGGFHIMLIDLKQALIPNDMVNLTLSFDDGLTQTIEAPVQGILSGMKMDMNMNDMDHSKMGHQMPAQ